jgi:hypothetical protein
LKSLLKKQKVFFLDSWKKKGEEKEEGGERLRDSIKFILD